MVPFPAQSLPFVHPGLAGFALIGAAIPVLIHLINRRRHRRVPWAAMQFLLAANKRSLRRLRMEQWLLLALRVALMAMVGFAIARPYFPATAFVPLGEARTHRVLILDDSLSMSAKRPDGRTRFDAAKVAALALLGSFPPGDAVSVVTMAAPNGTPIDHPAFDRRFARERVVALNATQRVGDPVSAMDAAVKIIRASELPEANRAAYILSDFQRRDWDPAAPGEGAAVRAVQRLIGALPRATDLVLVRVSDDLAANAAVTRLEAGPGPANVGVPVPLLAEVTNFGLSAMNGLMLQVRRDGAVLRRESLGRLEPSARSTVVIQVPFATPGAHGVEARLLSPADDALEFDDARHLSLEVRERTAVLIVDGRVGSFFERESSYLATALSPGAEEDAGRSSHSRSFEPKTVLPPELPSEALGAYDVVALCAVAEIPDAQEKAIEDFVHDGGGLVVFAGEGLASSPDRTATPAGATALPGSIEEIVNLSGSGGTRFVIDGRPHPIVAEFAGEPRSGLFSARVDRYARWALDAARGEVVLRFTGGDPAIVASDVGDGVAVFVATSANMAWNNLPARGDYVSLMHHLFGYAVARQGRQRNLMVGQSLRERLAADQASMMLRVAGPEGSNEDVAVASEGGVLRAEHGPLERAGVVTLGIGAESRVFAVNVDTVESELFTTDTAHLQAALGRGVRIIREDEVAELRGDSARATEVAPTLLILALGALMLESLLAARFGNAGR